MPTTRYNSLFSFLPHEGYTVGFSLHLHTCISCPSGTLIIDSSSCVPVSASWVLNLLPGICFYFLYYDLKTPCLPRGKFIRLLYQKLFFLSLQVRFSFGSFCWSSFKMSNTQTSLHGRGVRENSNYWIPSLFPCCGVSVNANQA